jgi:YVTN family beta-propeller protein
VVGATWRRAVSRLGGLVAAAGLFVGVVVSASSAAFASTTYPVTSTIGVGSNSEGVAVDPSTHSVYVTNEGGTVSVIDESGDAHTGTVTATITVGAGADGVAVDPSSHNVYVASSGANTVSVIDESGDTHTGTVTATIPVGYTPTAVAVDPINHNVYVTNINSDTVSVIDESGDAHSGTVTATITGFDAPNGVAVDPASHNVYVTNNSSDTVSVIDESGDVHTGTVIASVRVGRDPYWVAVDPTDHNVYAGILDKVSVIDESGDAHTGTVTDKIAVRGAEGLAVDPTSHNVYVTRAQDMVSVIDESGDEHTGTVNATITGFSAPVAVAVDPASHNVYVANYNSSTASVISPEGNIFDPYFQNVQSYPAGCSGPFGWGFTISGPNSCGSNPNTGEVDYVSLAGPENDNPGSSVTYTFVVPTDSDDTLTYAVPQGGYLNSAAGQVTLDGVADGTTAGGAGSGAECTTSPYCVYWTSPTLQPGHHTLIITAVADYINFYGIRRNSNRFPDPSN